MLLSRVICEVLTKRSDHGIMVAVLIYKENYMITKKKDAIEYLQRYKAIFTPILDKPCTISFDMHISDGFIVTDIIQRSLKDVKHKPEKILFDGKSRSPMIFEIVNNQAALYFLFDDTTVTSLGNGVRLSIPLDKPINDRTVIEIDIRLEG